MVARTVEPGDVGRPARGSGQPEAKSCRERLRDGLGLARSLSMLLAVCTGTSAAADAPTEGSLLAPIFQHHAVLQRDRPIRLFGQADAGSPLVITLAGRVLQVEADAQGDWRAELPALPAGGPHVLEVRSGSRRQRVEDVLVGEVWLCSGQSNMALPVRRTLDADSEIAQAQNARNRVLTVPEAASIRPSRAFARSAPWRLTRPDTVGEFSAACYYFARELQKQVDVPIGLIVAAWGGSRIQAWIPSEGLARLQVHAEDLDALHLYAEAPGEAAARWGERWAQWWQRHSSQGTQVRPWRPEYREGPDWADAPLDLGAWERWGLPALAAYDGMLWYRNTLRLSPEQARQSAVLELGPADETDVTWVNGRVVGSLYGPGEQRRYAVPAGLLRAGENLIAVNVLDTWRDGGLAGPASAHALRLADGRRISLTRAWRWRMASASSAPPRAPWQSAAGLSMLYNGMIAPLGDYGLRGVVWYQGESNTFEATQYAPALEALIADWRQQFGAPLAWLTVQLAGFGPPPTAPGESGWAELRAVQRRRGIDDPHYGLASAIDLGDRYDIHPPNKQELGRRLALVARHQVYGEADLTSAAPEPVRAWREDGQVVLQFDGGGARLLSYGSDQPIGFELCDAAESKESPSAVSGEAVRGRRCRYAQAQLDGSRLRLDAPNAATATHVRHAWADNPVITLFDSSGLPVLPFELPISPDARKE
jgi:sialate O-acetylesterase